ncbi:hypothetical protein OU798_18740 [Prolixibacteraceae bacterium Z1-6]|uniref:Uncharacterized protein n=1 Tax=Draconibacterium aestuarii TaxID=2998507 RepID=A0A9X3F898_9BACT|nr:hypothetical protein [Prolixibacteraceae bacterium Z1-6]
MTTPRTFKCKDVEMLMASKTILKSFSTNLTDLSMVRTNWTPEYASALEEEVDAAIDTYLGLDKKKQLRSATAILMAIQEPALHDLSFLKTQIEVDFGNDAKEIVKTLGYNTYLKDARKGDQEALTQLLYAFAKGMTDTLKAEIVAKGTNPALIERIVGYGSQLSQANVNQESLKETSKMVAEEAVEVFNRIYKEIIGICKIAANYYNNDPLRKGQFTFKKVIENMSVTPKTDAETPV